MANRGVVIAPKFTFDGRSLRFPGLAGIETEDLKYYLLYWDKIEHPDNNLISIGTSPDEQFLIDSALLTRTNISLKSFSGNIGFGYVLAQTMAFQQKNQQEPGLWTMAQSSNRLFLPNEYANPANTIEIELAKALPAPGELVTLDDVLAFKKKRQPELVALRSCMDDLYLSVVQSRDIPRAKNSAIERLENAIKEIQVVANESWKSKLLSSLKVELNIPDLIVKAGAIAGLSASFGLSPIAGAAIGAIGSVIKFEFTSMLKTKSLPQHLRDYAYIYNVEKELKS